MRRTLSAVCIGLAVAGLTLTAQTPQYPRPSQPQTPAATAPSNDTGAMTITGCLKPWTASTMSRIGASETTPPTPEAGAPSPNNDVQYVLTDIDDTTTRKPDGVAGTTGTSGSGSASRPGGAPLAHDMYLLKAKDSSVNFSQHLNHKVQVTGTVSSDSSSHRPSSTSPATPEPSSPRDTASAAGKPATLTVSSLTMISAICPTTLH